MLVLLFLVKHPLPCFGNFHDPKKSKKNDKNNNNNNNNYEDVLIGQRWTLRVPSMISILILEELMEWFVIYQILLNLVVILPPNSSSKNQKTQFQ